VEKEVPVWVRDENGVRTEWWNKERKQAMNNDEWQCGGQQNK